MIKTRKYTTKPLAIINKGVLERENECEILLLRNLIRSNVYYVGKLKERTLKTFVFEDGTELERNIYAKVFN